MVSACLRLRRLGLGVSVHVGGFCITNCMHEKMVERCHGKRMHAHVGFLGFTAEFQSGLRVHCPSFINAGYCMQQHRPCTQPCPCMAVLHMAGVCVCACLAAAVCCCRQRRVCCMLHHMCTCMVVYQQCVPVCMCVELIFVFLFREPASPCMGAPPLSTVSDRCGHAVLVYCAVDVVQPGLPQAMFVGQCAFAS